MIKKSSGYILQVILKFLYVMFISGFDFNILKIKNKCLANMQVLKSRKIYLYFRLAYCLKNISFLVHKLKLKKSLVNPLLILLFFAFFFILNNIYILGLKKNLKVKEQIKCVKRLKII